MARSRVLRLVAISAAGIAVGVAGCDGSTLPGFDLGSLLGDAGTGELRMLVTDDPFPHELVAEAWVTITRVEVFRARGLEPGDSEPDDLEAEAHNDELSEDLDPNAAADPNDAGDPNGLADPNGVAEPLDDQGDIPADDLADEDPKDDGQTAKKGGALEAGDPSDDEDAADPDALDDGDAGDGDDGDDGDAGDAGDADGEDAGGRPFIVVFDDPAGRDYNLLELRNGRVAELFEEELPAGHYTKVRIIVSGGWVVLTDGRDFPLRVPSGDRTGIKLRVDFEVYPDEQSELLLDFDLTKSFVPVPGGKIAQAGDIREFKFRPSQGMRVANRSRTGDLSGEVVDADGNPVENISVTAFDGEAEIASAVTEDDGGYALLGLPPGQYRLRFEGDGFQVRELHNRRVAAGDEDENADIELEPENDQDAGEPEPVSEDDLTAGA